MNSRKRLEIVLIVLIVSVGILQKDTVEKVSENILNIALGSGGEYHSCIFSFYKADQLTKEEYEQLDKLHYKTENELIQLIKSLQKKMKEGDWEDTFG